MQTFLWIFLTEEIDYRVLDIPRFYILLYYERAAVYSVLVSRTRGKMRESALNCKGQTLSHGPTIQSESRSACIHYNSNAVITQLLSRP